MIVELYFYGCCHLCFTLVNLKLNYFNFLIFLIYSPMHCKGRKTTETIKTKKVFPFLKLLNLGLNYIKIMKL